MEIFEIVKFVSAVIAIIAFGFAVYKFQIERRTNMFWKEFEVYHKLIKELVEPPSENGAMYVDRQTAILYELRNFERYFPHSLRMLEGLQEKWNKVPNQFPRLLEELELTITFLKNKNVKG